MANTPAADTGRTPEIRGGTASVYILEPDGPESDHVAALVNRLGARPRVLTSIADLVAARPGPGDCVVAEMCLPGGDDGLKLLAALKAAGLGLPVIFVTGDRDVGRAVLALRAGAVDYLVKPWIEQRLAARLRAALGLSDPG